MTGVVELPGHSNRCHWRERVASPCPCPSPQYFYGPIKREKFTWMVGLFFLIVSLIMNFWLNCWSVWQLHISTSFVTKLGPVCFDFEGFPVLPQWDSFPIEKKKGTFKVIQLQPQNKRWGWGFQPLSLSLFVFTLIYLYGCLLMRKLYV